MFFSYRQRPVTFPLHGQKKTKGAVTETPHNSCSYQNGQPRKKSHASCQRQLPQQAADTKASSGMDS